MAAEGKEDFAHLTVGERRLSEDRHANDCFWVRNTSDCRFPLNIELRVKGGCSERAAHPVLRNGSLVREPRGEFHQNERLSETLDPMLALRLNQRLNDAIYGLGREIPHKVPVGVVVEHSDCISVRKLLRRA